MSIACQEIVSLNNSLTRSFFPVELRCDNKAAIICANTNRGNKLRHMTGVHDNYVKECVKYERVKTQWVVTTNQLADILTKALSFKLHKELTDKILNYEE